MSNLRWQWCTLHELTSAELYSVLAARSRVFVVEQACAYLDADGYDLDAQHLVVWSGGDVAGYLRVIDAGVKYVERSLGRVLTAQTLRGTGLGRELMARALEHLDSTYPGQPLRIGAQARLRAFYESFGFQQASRVYIEDAIPHIEMLRMPL